MVQLDVYQLYKLSYKWDLRGAVVITLEELCHDVGECIYRRGCLLSEIVAMISGWRDLRLLLAV